MHRRVVVVVVALALVVVAAGGFVAWRWLSRTEFEEAVAAVPASTLRLSYTDWAAVRSSAGGSDVDAGSSAGSVTEFLNRAFEQDLVSASAIHGSTSALADRYGFSPLNVVWEAFGQSREGAVVVLRLPSSADFAGIERKLRTLGYDAPAAGAGSGQVWAGSADLVARIDPTLTPVVQNVVVLEEEQAVLLSDSASYASSAADVLRGSAESLAEADSGAASLAEVAEEPVSAVMWASDFACSDLSMSLADAEDQAVAEQLVESAGEVSPLSGLVMAHEPDRSLVVGMHFESSDQAESNLRPRASLASGEAVGQGGTFPDRFSISSARTTGANVVLTLEPVAEDEDSRLLSDLSQGPVLFATC